MFYCQKEGNYTFVNKSKSWDDASSYCEKNYKHLATFERSNMENIFTEKDFPVWVGMRREGDIVTWTSGNSNYENWTEGEPRDGYDCVTISSQTKLMATENCSVDLPFVCMYEVNSNVLLVKENKSWEEALEHCRGLSNSVLRYDLVSVQPGDEHERTMSKAMEADTEEVWTGLRFLGDEWLWVNGESTMGSYEGMRGGVPKLAAAGPAPLKIGGQAGQVQSGSPPATPPPPSRRRARRPCGGPPKKALLRSQRGLHPQCGARG
ncbi:uncharacterized protein LOC118556397 [Fundulus heteroclitus]|uniref:uncharacterized protein LOC118556397 n=1 Tax=Fundulus heteroclitus TaxID=8078 RepID=UPI00165C6107|nr:uncharacterized protein LOC118556397 [Fundulus heteroclitus]